MFNSLSDTQKLVVENSGKFVVRACPGSGKTYCVAARLAKLINSWDYDRRGIATLSFTNVAWKEIKNQCENKFGLKNKIEYPHFLGTIDSFINKMIFLPFGHLIMGKGKNKPVLVGEPYQSWIFSGSEKNYEQYFDILSYDINGDLCCVGKNQIFHWGGWNKAFNINGEPNGHHKNLSRIKESFLKAGYATQADANYFSMKLLEEYPVITKSIVHRFPYLIVDEAQDTSDIQMRVIDLLIEQGLQEIVLVGDPDQAIYEWNDARPDLLLKKYEEWDNSIVLNENRRSSKNICVFTQKLSSLNEVSDAVTDEVRNHPHKPEIIEYNDNTIQSTIDYFFEECVNNGIEINKKTTAILYRGGAMLNRILGVPESTFIDAWDKKNPLTKEIMYGKFLFDKNDFIRGQNILEKAYVKIKNKKSICSEQELSLFIHKVGYREFKLSVHNFINGLPKVDEDTKINEWLTLSNQFLESIDPQYVLKIKPISNDCTFGALFSFYKEKVESFPCKLSTIHGIKGETYEAVLVLLRKGSGDRKHYKTILNAKETVETNEELRIVYVAITRPRQIVLLGVQNGIDEWNNFFDI